MLKYQKMVEKALARNEIANPVEALCGLLWLLREQHTTSAAFGTGSGFSDGLDSLTSRHATTLAESIRNYARVTAAAHKHNARVLRNAGNAAAAEDLETAAPRIQAVCDMLTKSVRVWNFEAGETEASIARARGPRPHKPPGDGPVS
jgi:hypothetical protein